MECSTALSVFVSKLQRAGMLDKSRINNNNDEAHLDPIEFVNVASTDVSTLPFPMPGIPKDAEALTPRASEDVPAA
jgi:hypothetical protein